MALRGEHTHVDTSVLLVDVGNTNVKWSWMYNEILTPVESATHVRQDPAALAPACWGARPAPACVVMANVANPALGDGLADWISLNWGVRTIQVRPTARAFGVTNAYAIPEQLGVDRWLTLLAAHRAMARPVCIVDCGTAITIDLMDGKGLHLGGLILPGFNMMRESLLEKTHIPRVTHMDTAEILGKDTASAVASAALHAAAALVERVMDRISGSLSQRPALLITGSDAVRLQSALKIPCEISPDLVMQGLSLFAAESRV